VNKEIIKENEQISCFTISLRKRLYTLIEIECEQIKKEGN
jgi:hypothetical protein